MMLITCPGQILSGKDQLPLPLSLREGRGQMLEGQAGFWVQIWTKPGRQQSEGDHANTRKISHDV